MTFFLTGSQRVSASPKESQALSDVVDYPVELQAIRLNCRPSGGIARPWTGSRKVSCFHKEFQALKKLAGSLKVLKVMKVLELGVSKVHKHMDSLQDCGVFADGVVRWIVEVHLQVILFDYVNFLSLAIYFRVVCCTKIVLNLLEIHYGFCHLREKLSPFV